jgi:hypothetical protein
MMGLLDQVTEDPSQMGLLSMGLRLMSTPGKFGTAFGQSGLGAIEDMQKAKMQAQERKNLAQREQLMAMELERQKAIQQAAAVAAARKARDDQLLAGAFRPMPGPQPDGTAGVMPRFDMQGLIGSGLSMDSVPEAIKLQQLLNPARKLRDVAPGASVVDEANPTVPLFTNPKEDTPDPVSKLMAARDKFPKGSPQWSVLDAALTKATTHAPAPSASVVMKQEGAESQVVGKGFGEQYLKIQEAGLGAQKTIARADQFASLLDGVNTGKLTPLGTELAAYGQSLGMKIDPKLGNKQAAEALSNQMALELRNPAGGAGMPGAMSDQDRSFLKNMTANIGKTPEANAMILDATRKLAKRDQEVAALARSYRAKKGSLDEGFYNELDAFSKANPLFPQVAPLSTQPARKPFTYVGPGG